MVLEGYRRLAFYDVRKVYDENNKLLDVSKLDEETAFALVALEVTEAKTINAATVYTKKIKMSDRKGALDSNLQSAMI
jgi:phage terminase small subunit